MRSVYSWEQRKVLGSGSFGEVFAVKHRAASEGERLGCRKNHLGLLGRLGTVERRWTWTLTLVVFFLFSVFLLNNC